MKVNLNFNLKGFDKDDILDPSGNPVNIGKFLAGVIMNSQAVRGQDIMKYFDWSKQLYEAGEIDLDRADQQKFKDFVLGLDTVSLIVKGTILEVLESKNGV